MSPANSADRKARYYPRKNKGPGEEFSRPFVLRWRYSNPFFLSVGVRQSTADSQVLSDLESHASSPSFPFSSGITRLADEKNDFTVILVTPRIIAP
jgi:hypothetical protein